MLWIQIVPHLFSDLYECENQITQTSYFLILNSERHLWIGYILLPSQLPSPPTPPPPKSYSLGWLYDLYECEKQITQNPIFVVPNSERHCWIGYIPNSPLSPPPPQKNHIDWFLSLLNSCWLQYLIPLICETKQKLGNAFLTQLLGPGTDSMFPLYCHLKALCIDLW